MRKTYLTFGTALIISTLTGCAGKPVNIDPLVMKHHDGVHISDMFSDEYSDGLLRSHHVLSSIELNELSLQERYSNIDEMKGYYLSVKSLATPFLKTRPVKLLENDESIRLVVPYAGYFTENQVNDHLKEALAEFSLVLRENEFWKTENIVVSVHSSDLTISDYTMYETQDKAESVRKILINNFLDPDRVVAFGFGSNHPFSPGVKNIPQNERVEFYIEKSDAAY